MVAGDQPFAAGRQRHRPVAAAADLGGKRIEILREIVPGLKRLAILANVGNPVTASEIRQVQEAARSLGLEIVNSEIRRGEDIAPAIEALKDRADAIYVQTDPIMNTHRVRISTLALGARLPTLSGIREYVEAGILMSYGANFLDLFRRAATMSTRSCAARSRPTCRSSSRPSSTW